ncbi:hypothetical protein EMN47_20160 [Prolixibacteraceae bacterium JC049]|nr:hypothetical protein [Prolixibacteraceae bacterium JC049]
MKKLATILILVLGVQLVSAQNKYSTAIFYDNAFLLDNNKTFNGKDSLVIKVFDNGEIKSRGKYAIDNDGNVSDLKIGKWTEYYSDGVVKCEGNYQISSYVDCGAAGLERVFYNYKVGGWSYFTSNGILAAKGKYKIINAKIDTRCKNGDNLIFMTITKDWKISDQTVDKKVLESVKQEYDDGFCVESYYDSKKNKVIVNYGIK